MEQYYSKRAAEYEQIYQKPERQHELEWLRGRIPAIFRDRTVLEVACGTGYWTQYIARTAAKVHACDINDSVLEIDPSRVVPPFRLRGVVGFVGNDGEQHVGADIAPGPRRRRQQRLVGRGEGGGGVAAAEGGQAD